MIHSIKDFHVLTSNPKKSRDFTKEGFIVEHYDDAYPEIQCGNTPMIALYKALHTGKDNIIVEDTALYMEGTDIGGTNIKHVYEKIRDDKFFHGTNVQWEVSVCLRRHSHSYVFTAIQQFVLNYPASDQGYSFESLIAHSETLCPFPNMSEEEQNQWSPRIAALQKLKQWCSGDRTVQPTIQIENYLIQPWAGEFQLE